MKARIRCIAALMGAMGVVKDAVAEGGLLSLKVTNGTPLPQFMTPSDLGQVLH